ncbi:hypothetical protein PshuTeo2_40970 [Pseudomonas hunanensis]|nr:hypothetical protein [Pseudomonas hunanensis]
MSRVVFRGATLGLLCGWLPVAGASGFVDDSKLKLQLRNVYFNENFRDEQGMSARAAATAKSERVEWAQGFLLDYQSGFTQGTLGVGLDALGLLGVRLDSGRGRSGAGLLPVHDDGRAADEFASAGVTAKARLGSTVVKHGTLLPKTPVLVYNDARVLPQTYQGTQLTSTDIDGLTLTAGHLDRFKQRDSSNSTGIYLDGYGGGKSGDFSFAGADYAVSKQLRLSVYHGQLEHFYRQDFAGLVHDLPLAGGVLTTDLRYFKSRDSGRPMAAASTTRCSVARWRMRIPAIPWGPVIRCSMEMPVCRISAVRPFIRSATSASASSSRRKRKPGWPATPTTSRPPACRG